MDWSTFIKSEKVLSSLQLDQPDVTYQVWELGGLLAQITDNLARLDGHAGTENDEDGLTALLGRTTVLFENFQYLCKRLCEDATGVLGDIKEIERSVERLLKMDSGMTLAKKTDDVREEMKDWNRRIGYELRAKSIHLRNVFSLSYGLKSLRAALLHNIQQGDVREHIKASIRDVDKLEKGDKILTSPNLEITPQNLGIIKSRLTGLLKHLDVLKKFARAHPEEYEFEFQRDCTMWEDLILDIRNPDDYMTRKRKLLIKIVPFLACYYIVVTPVVVIVKFELWPQSDAGLLIPLILGLVPLFIALLRWVYDEVKNRMIISCFRFPSPSLRKKLKKLA